MWSQSLRLERVYVVGSRAGASKSLLKQQQDEGQSALIKASADAKADSEPHAEAEKVRR